MADARYLIDLLQDGNISDFNEERPAVLDLFGADLAELDLSGIDLRRVRLAKADLSGAKLFSARLEGADLEGVDLTEAAFGDTEIKDASFKDANIEGVEASGSFTNCDFSGSTWSGTATRGCKFVRCKFEGAEFASGYFKRHNNFDQCTPEELFEPDDEPQEEKKPTAPDFLAAKPAPKTGDKVEVLSYQVELSPEIIDGLLRFLSKEGNADAVSSGKLSLRTFGDQLYLGLSAKGEKSPLTDWIRFELVKGTFYRSTELKSFDPDFVNKVAVPLAKRYRGALRLLFTKKGDRKKYPLNLEDGREVSPEELEPRRFGGFKPASRPALRMFSGGSSSGENEDQILAEAEPLPDEDANDE